VLSLVVPAYNEVHRVGATLRAYLGFLRARGEPFEVLVVCDGCTDGTERVVRGFRGVRVLTFPERLGKGGGVRAGFARARGDVLAFVDADNSVAPEQLARLLDAAHAGAEAAVASRHAPGAVVTATEPAGQRFASRVFNLLARLLFALPFRDTQCGGKVVRAAAYRAVEPRLLSTGFEFDAELLWRLHRAGYRVVEVPVKWAYRRGARFSVLQAPRMLWGLLRARLAP